MGGASAHTCPAGPDLQGGCAGGGHQHTHVQPAQACKEGARGGGHQHTHVQPSQACKESARGGGHKAGVRTGSQPLHF